MIRGLTVSWNLVALVLAAVCWGSGTVVSKRALAEFPPLTLLAVQLASGLAVLALVRASRREPRSNVPPALARLGILNPGLAYALSLIGLATISASLSVVLWALEPILIVVLAMVVLHESVTARFAVSSLAAVAGMVVVAFDPTGSRTILGVTLTVLGVGCCAAYTILARRFLMTATVPSTLAVVEAQQRWALGVAIAAVAGVAVVGSPTFPVGISPGGVASAIGSGVIYYAAAYWFYLGALRHVAASRAIVAFYLIPVVGVAGGLVVLGDRLDVRQWIGVVIVLVATAVNLRTRESRESIAG